MSSLSSACASSDLPSPYLLFACPKFRFLETGRSTFRFFRRAEFRAWNPRFAQDAPFGAVGNFSGSNFRHYPSLLSKGMNYETRSIS